MNLQQIIPLNRLFLFCCLFSAAALLSSWWAEYLWHLQLCSLCKAQRLILAVVLPLSLLGLVVSNKKWPAVLLLLLLILLFFVAGYHLLVRWGFAADRCATPQNIQTLVDFQSMLYASTPCTASWSLLGIPVSIYNSVFALVSILGLKNHLPLQSNAA